MLAVVKKPHTKQNILEIKGDIPNHLITYLKMKFGNRLTLTNEEKNYINITETSWYKKQKSRRTPGKTVKIYRERDNLTQAELGQKLGNLSPQKISDIEHDRRGISKNLAKKLALFFGTSVDRFI